MYIGLYVKYPLFLSDFNRYFNTVDRFSKNSEIQNFIKIRPWEPSYSMRAGGPSDGQTERHDERNTRFLQFFESV